MERTARRARSCLSFSLCLSLPYFLSLFLARDSRAAAFAPGLNRSYTSFLLVQPSWRAKNVLKKLNLPESSRHADFGCPTNGWKPSWHSIFWSKFLSRENDIWWITVADFRDYVTETRLKFLLKWRLYEIEFLNRWRKRNTYIRAQFSFRNQVRRILIEIQIYRTTVK